MILAGLLAAVLLETPAPIGHFTSAEGQDRYRAAYTAAMNDLPPPERTLDVRTSYGIVRVYRFAPSAPEAGGAVPLVLLPGTMSGAPVFADNVPGLRQIAPVYALDLLGEPGMSIQDRPMTSRVDQAQWLAEVLAQLPEPRLHLVGLSIGGWTATNLVLNRPDKVAGLILLDAVHVFGDIPLGTVLRSVPAAVPWLPRSWRDSFSSFTAGGAPVEGVAVGDMIEAGMQTYSMRQPSPSSISAEELGTIEIPVLAIIAGNSVMHDARAAAERARAALRHGTVVVYDGASHALNGEQPDRIAADIRAFVRAVA